MRGLMIVLLLLAGMAPAVVVAEESGSQTPLSATDCKVVFMDMVNNDTMKALMGDLELRASCSQILLIIDTPGGDVMAANFFLPDLEAMKLHTHIRGEAASMGVPLFLAGTYRTMDAGADLFLHQLLVPAQVFPDMNIDALKKMSESLSKLQTRYIGYVSVRTGQANERILDMMQKETTVSPDDALKLGFVSEIKTF